MTTGFYFAANDGALNCFTVGANGHITSNQTTAPTAGTNATGKPPVPASPPDPSGAGQSGTPNGYVNLSVNDPTQPGNVNESQPSAPSLLNGGGTAPDGTAQSAPPLPQGQ